MQGWNVIRKNKVIETVFFDDNCDNKYVRSSLIDHDGFPSDIKVRKAK